ncbi:MAG TPA: PQQ-binding-like beta-propeller repeat protein [Acetobacteraceae bacterium]|nr:PQQ-binding-like beta-propeller repeat protein [Acetobacteraceae bacterium]
MAENSLVERRGFARRAALLAPLALGGCSLWDSWFGTEKPPLPGTREPVIAPGHGLTVDPGAPKVVLPPPVRNAAWPQAGGNPAHVMGHLAANPVLAQAWAAGIGAGGGYRQQLLAQPVVANGLVYTMDSNAVVSAFTLAGGTRVWRMDSRHKHRRDSTNVGGGLAVAGDMLYAVNGLGDLVALDAAKGAQKWRTSIGVPGRSAPTVVEGRLFLTTIEDKLLALAADDGRQIWAYQALAASPSVLGRPAPAFANGLVVAGFSSGELACLRADSGNVLWTDNLGGTAGGASADFSAIRGRPAISNGRVLATGMGGLTLGLDLPTGRRLWERDVGSEDSPWIAGDWMFIIAASQEMAAIGTADGRVAWVSALPRWNNPKKQSGAITWWGPALLGDRLVVAGTNRDALSISPYTGAILGRQTLSAAAAPLEPVVAGGTLLLVTNDGRLLALR